MKTILFIFAICIGQMGILAQSGSNDPTFNPSDIGFGFGDGANDMVSHSVTQSDGKIIICGQYTSFNSASSGYITRLNSDGSVDPDFNTGTGPDNKIHTVALQQDGKIIIGGQFNSFNGFSRNYIARLNSDGSLDLSFNIGSGASWDVFSIAIQPDNKIIIAGQFISYNGVSRHRIARLNVDGSLDIGFNPWLGANGLIYTTDIQNDGKILIGGDFTHFNGISQNHIARLNSDGTIDSSFDTGSGANNWVRSIKVQSNGKILVGGWFTSFNDEQMNRLVRLNIDGSIDNTFNIGTGFSFNVSSIGTYNDGKVVVGGQFTTYNGFWVNRITRLNSDGSYDITFNQEGNNLGSNNGANNLVTSNIVQPDGKILITGLFTSYNNMQRNRVARLNNDGSLDTSFNHGSGANNWIFASVIQPDGKIIIAGRFTTYNGTSCGRIARINPDGSLDGSFNSGIGANGDIQTISLQSDGKIVIGGFFSTIDGVSRNRIARLNANGSLDFSFNPGTGVPATAVLTTAIQSDGKIIIGGIFSSYNGYFQLGNVTRLNTDGSLDLSFDNNSAASDWVFGSQIQSDGKIILVGQNIKRLNSNGTVDLSFDAGMNSDNYIYSCYLQPDGKILIAGDFTMFNDIAMNRLARLNNDGSLDTSFNPSIGADNTINVIVAQPDNKILIGGQFTNYNGTSINRLARLNSDGTLDTQMNYSVGSDGGIRSISLQSDGKIIIAGQFTSYNNLGRNRISRIFGLPCQTVYLEDEITSINPITWIDGNTYTSSNNSATYLIPGNGIDACDTLVSLNFTLLNVSTDVGTNSNCSPGPCQSYNYQGPKILINEVMLSPSLGDGSLIDDAANLSTRRGEWIELYNPNLCESVDISCYYMGSSSIVAPSGGFGFRIPNNTIVPPGGFVLLRGINAPPVPANELIINGGNTIEIVLPAFVWEDGVCTAGPRVWFPNGGGWFAFYDTDGVPQDAISWASQSGIGMEPCVAQSTNCSSVASLSSYENIPSDRKSNVSPQNAGLHIDQSIRRIPDGAQWSGVGSPSLGACNQLPCQAIPDLSSCNGMASVQVSGGQPPYQFLWNDPQSQTTSTAIGLCSGDYQVTITDNNGASVNVAVTIMNSISEGIDTQTACSSFTWIDGNTYTSSNNSTTFNIVGGAANGCDSLVTLNLTILQPAEGTDTQTACSSFTWIDGNTYTSSNNSTTFNIVGGAANGCDSLVTLNLTILQPAEGTDTQTACSSFTWIDGNTYTANNNSATFNIIGGALNGCDSLVTLNLTILQPAEGTDTQTACSSFTWIDGNTYTASNNSATFNIIGGAANGCDSLVTLNLTIENVDVSVTLDGITLTAGATNAQYQWLDCLNNSPIAGATNQSFTATENGDYAVIVFQGNCSDTSVCAKVSAVSIIENKDFSIIAFPNPTQGTLKIQAQNTTINNLRVLDLNGKIVLTQSNLNQTTCELDLSPFENGFYIVEIKTEFGIERVPVAKNDFGE